MRKLCKACCVKVVSIFSTIMGVSHINILVILSEAKNLVPRILSCLENLTISIYARSEILRFAQNDMGTGYASPSQSSW